MLTFSSFLISAAYAQDAPAAPADATAMGLMNYLPFVLIFGVFYFLVIRPQQKKLGDQEKMVKALQRGDRIITSGGIHGKIAKMEGDDQLIVEMADNVQIRIDRVAVAGLEAKTQPVVVESEKK